MKDFDQDDGAETEADSEAEEEKEIKEEEKEENRIQVTPEKGEYQLQASQPAVRRSDPTPRSYGAVTAQ